MIFDQLDPSDRFECDICVVGAGPVGLALALRLAQNGQSVTLLEAGGAIPETAKSDAFDIDSADPNTHADRCDISRQGLGGTSSVWGGGCAPYSAYDFRQRAHVPHSGIPIPYRELTDYFKDASQFFGISPDFFDARHDMSDQEFSTGQLTRITPTANMADRHLQQIRSSTNMRLYLNTRVTKLHYDPATTKITGLDAISGDRVCRLTPRLVVICCGGIQTTRMLLLLQRQYPLLWGGHNGPLGRYYMGHLSGSIARIAFANPSAARTFLYTKDDQGTFWRRHLSPTPQIQIRHRLLNMYFSPASFPLADPGCKSGALSALHMALALRHHSANYMRHYRPGHVRNAFDFDLNAPAHLANMLRSPFCTMKDMAKVAWERMSAQPRPIGFQLNNHAGIYALHFHAEQFPNPASRIILSDRCDSNGMPLPQVNLKFADADFNAVLRGHDLLSAWVVKRGFGKIAFRTDPGQRLAHIRAQARDGFHQMGSVRISKFPTTGVVDANLSAFGVSNLFIAGAAVLPTGGQAHPTFTAVSLALRLADHLQKRSRSASPRQSESIAALSGS